MLSYRVPKSGPLRAFLKGQIQQFKIGLRRVRQYKASVPHISGVGEKAQLLFGRQDHKPLFPFLLAVFYARIEQKIRVPMSLELSRNPQTVDV